MIKRFVSIEENRKGRLELTFHLFPKDLKDLCLQRGELSKKEISKIIIDEIENPAMEELK